MSKEKKDKTVIKYNDSVHYYQTKKDSIVEAEKAYYMVEEASAFPGRSHTVSTLTRRSVEIVYPRVRARFMTGGQLGVSTQFHGDNSNMHLEELIESYLTNKINVDMDAYNDIRDFIKQGIRSGTTMLQLWWNKDKQRAEIDTIDVFDIHPEPRCKDIKEVKDGNCWMIIEELTTIDDINNKIEAGIYEDFLSDVNEEAAGSKTISGEADGRDRVNDARLFPSEMLAYTSELVAKKLMGEDKDGYISLLHEVQGNNVRTVSKNGGIELRDTKFERFPFHLWKFYPSPFDFFGEGIGELIKHIQSEATLIRNQRRDMQNLNINGMWSWEEGAQIDFYALQNPRPGGLVRCGNHGDFQAIRAPGHEMMDRAFNDEQLLNVEADSLLNISDYQRGSKSGANLTSTASGIQMILEQSGLKIGESEEDLGHVLSGLLQDVLFMYKDHMKLPEAVRVSGREGIKWQQITKEDISDQIKVTVKMDTDLGDNNMKLQRYVQLLNILQGFGNTVDTMPILKEILKLHDFPNPDAVFPQYQDVQMDPETENIMMERGYPISVSPQDDHEAHVEIHSQIGNIADEHILEHQDAWAEGGLPNKPKQNINAQIGAAQPQQQPEQQPQGMGPTNVGQQISADAGQMGGY